MRYLNRKHLEFAVISRTHTHTHAHTHSQIKVKVYKPLNLLGKGKPLRCNVCDEYCLLIRVTELQTYICYICYSRALTNSMVDRSVCNTRSTLTDTLAGLYLKMETRRI